MSVCVSVHMFVFLRVPWRVCFSGEDIASDSCVYAVGHVEKWPHPISTYGVWHCLHQPQCVGRGWGAGSFSRVPNTALLIYNNLNEDRHFLIWRERTWNSHNFPYQWIIMIGESITKTRDSTKKSETVTLPRAPESISKTNDFSHPQKHPTGTRHSKTQVSNEGPQGQTIHSENSKSDPTARRQEIWRTDSDSARKINMNPPNDSPNGHEKLLWSTFSH